MTKMNDDPEERLEQERVKNRDLEYDIRRYQNEMILYEDQIKRMRVAHDLERKNT